MTEIPGVPEMNSLSEMNGVPGTPELRDVEPGSAQYTLALQAVMARLTAQSPSGEQQRLS